MPNITAKTKQLAIIGNPVEHSFSPKMHNFISDKIGADYVYTAWKVENGDVGKAISGIRALGISGVNVTAPYKKSVMRFLDDVSDDALELGSVNTIVNRDGELCGYNTDADGIFMAMQRAGISVKDKRVLIFGAGGVAKPILIRTVKEKPLTVSLMNRTPEKAKALADEVLRDYLRKVYLNLGKEYPDIIINTTSAGMAPQLDALPTDEIDGVSSPSSFLSDQTVVIDLIYNPEETKFLRLARERGLKTMNGLDMLIYQGILSYELFTGIKLPDNMCDMIRKEVFGK